MLVGDTATEVCAGSPGMIEEALHLLANGKWRSQPDGDPIVSLLPDTGRLLDYAEAVGDLMFWMLVFGLRSRELVQTLSAQVDRLCSQLPQREAWMAQAVAKLADFQIAGFAAQSLPVLGVLDPASSEVMIRGVIPLFRDLRAEEGRGALFQRGDSGDVMAEIVELVAWLRESRRWRECSAPELERKLGAVIARCVRVEREGLRMFSRFQESIHRALGRLPASPVADGGTLTALFGKLASACFGDVLGIGIQANAGECVLTGDMRPIRLRELYV
jgi:hypothetical protein